MGASRGKSLRVQMPQACETVPFSCRLKDANSGIRQQQAATGGNSQREEVKAFRLQAATGGKSRQHAATRLKPRC
jgi:hypothetical protein